jgi:hypothetical protein
MSTTAPAVEVKLRDWMAFVGIADDVVAVMTARTQSGPPGVTETTTSGRGSHGAAIDNDGIAAKQKRTSAPSVQARTDRSDQTDRLTVILDAMPPEHCHPHAIGMARE